MEAIKAILSTIDDIEPAQRGEMTLYSPSRNLRIMITTAAKVTEQMKDEFEAKVCELKPEIALFISAADDIDFDIANETTDGEHILCIYATREDLTPRFVRMLENMEPVQPEQEHESKPKAEKPKKASKPKPKPKPEAVKKSQIDNYEDNEEGFDKYCHEIAKSKIEFKKAQLKWPKEMKPYTTLAKLTEHILSLKEAKPEPTQASDAPTTTTEDFNKYITETQPSKITKTYLRAEFSHLPEAQALIDSKNFRVDVQELRKSLSTKE